MISLIECVATDLRCCRSGSGDSTAPPLPSLPSSLSLPSKVENHSLTHAHPPTLPPTERAIQHRAKLTRSSNGTQVLQQELFKKTEQLGAYKKQCDSLADSLQKALNELDLKEQAIHHLEICQVRP